MACATESELDILASYLDGYSVAGSKLKESGNTHWYTENSDATNSSGFTALPGGYRSRETGDYHNLGSWGFLVFYRNTWECGRYMFSNGSTNFDNTSDGKMTGLV